MSVQASAEHACTPRDDQGPYTEVEVGYPSKKETLLLPWGDDASEAYDGPPTMYAHVPAAVVKTVVSRHGGLREDSGEMPALMTEEEKENEAEEEERDENGCLWAAAAVPPTTTEEESSTTDDEHRSPYSMIHMGAPPPPPPPLPQTDNTPHTQQRTGALTSPQQLRQLEMSPIETDEE